MIKPAANGPKDFKLKPSALSDALKEIAKIVPTTIPSLLPYSPGNTLESEARQINTKIERYKTKSIPT